MFISSLQNFTIINYIFFQKDYRFISHILNFASRLKKMTRSTLKSKKTNSYVLNLTNILRQY